jgi:predicted small metal-binding protein
MAKVIECPCGTVLRADDDSALVQLAQQHARQTHAMELTREQALAMSRRE